MIWLKELRAKSGMTEKQIAFQSGISQQFYNYIENGKRRPSVETAKKIAALLGFDWTRFYEDGE